MVINAGEEAATVANVSSIIDPSILDDIATSQDDLDRLAETLKQNMEQLHSLQDSFETAVKKQQKMLKKVGASQKAQQAQKTARKFYPPPSQQQQQQQQQFPTATPTTTTSTPPHNHDDTSDNNQPSAPPLTAEEQARQDSELQFVRRLDGLKSRLKHSLDYMPSTGGRFVELFLGSIDIRFRRKSERLRFKSEYELVKLKFAPIGVLFCIICLALPRYRWLHMIFQLSLSAYYVTLAVRENILRKNGSNIRSWWITHHYLTMMQSVVLLTWSNGQSYSEFSTPLHLFGLYNAVLMIFQTRYQMSRIYALKSLGMASEMDVASSDNTQIHWSETMFLLLPIIIFGQIMQGCLAVKLYTMYFLHYPAEFQILLLGILFSANFVGNVLTTIQVILHKRKKSRNTLDTPSTSSRAPAWSASNSVATTLTDASMEAVKGEGQKKEE